jgi:hypothetical protein
MPTGARTAMYEGWDATAGQCHRSPSAPCPRARTAWATRLKSAADCQLDDWYVVRPAHEVQVGDPWTNPADAEARKCDQMAMTLADDQAVKIRRDLPPDAEEVAGQEKRCPQRTRRRYTTRPPDAHEPHAPNVEDDAGANPAAEAAA